MFVPTAELPTTYQMNCVHSVKGLAMRSHRLTGSGRRAPPSEAVSSSVIIAPLITRGVFRLRAIDIERPWRTLQGLRTVTLPPPPGNEEMARCTPGTSPRASR